MLSFFQMSVAPARRSPPHLAKGSQKGDVWHPVAQATTSGSAATHECGFMCTRTFLQKRFDRNWRSQLPIESIRRFVEVTQSHCPQGNLQHWQNSSLASVASPE